MKYSPDQIEKVLELVKAIDKRVRDFSDEAASPMHAGLVLNALLNVADGIARECKMSVTDYKAMMRHFGEQYEIMSKQSEP